MIPPDLGSRSKAPSAIGSLVMPEPTTPLCTTISTRVDIPQPPLAVTCVAEGSHLGRPRTDAHGGPISAPKRPLMRAVEGGDAMRDAQADVPSA